MVVPGMPHHVVQRGNRRQDIFVGIQSHRLYLRYLVEACTLQEVKCLAWCLMDNHVHLALTPPTADALRAVMASTHTRYAVWFNASQQCSGHLFQGRYHSYPMDESHLIAAVRYIENNPVKAGLVARAEDWAWSSARAHVEGIDDGLTDRMALAPHLPNWRAYLELGAEAAEDEETIAQALVSGRPQGTPTWLASQTRPGRPRGRPKKTGSKIGTVLI
jgi:putative transposase